MTNNAMTISVAEKASTFPAGDNKACSNGRSRKDECNGSEGVRTRDGGSSKKRPLCYGSGSWKELLCLQGFWAHGPSLWE